MTKAKKTQGKKKIEIKKINNPSNRQVTFSKRRVGLFKKAAELCILSGAEIAIIVQSLGGRHVFSFGHPTVDIVVNRFLSGSANFAHDEQPVPVQPNLQREFNKHYYDSCKELEMERKRKDAIDKEKKMVGGSAGGGRWWDEPFDGMDMNQLEEFGAALEELMNNATMRANDLMLLHSSNGMMSNTRIKDESVLINQDQMNVIGHPQL